MKAGTVKEFPREAVMLDEGAEIEEVYLILRGMVSVSLYPSVNPALWLYVAGPGTLVDVSALLDPPISPVSIRALWDIEVLAIPRDAFADLMKEEASVGYEILQNHCNRLALINRVALKQLAQEFPGPSLN